MKITGKNVFMLIPALGLTILAWSQDSAKIAVLTVRSVEKSYYIGQVPAIEVTLKNVSKKTICFDQSPQGSFKIELYDLLDSTGTDLLKPYREGDKPAHRRTLSVCAELDPGQSETHVIDLSVSEKQLLTHTGSYKVLVSRREAESRVNIIGNPVTIKIIPK